MEPPALTNHFHPKSLEFLKLIPGEVFLLDRELRIADLSVAAAHVFLYSGKLVEESFVQALIPKNAQSEFRMGLLSVLETGTPFNFESAVLRGDGSERIYSWYCARMTDDAGDAIGLTVTGQDVTPINNLDMDRSRRNLLNYRYALDTAAIVAITDLAGKITYANQKFCEISGYSAAELLGQNHRILSSKFHPPEFFLDMWKTIASGKVWRGEIRNRAKAGHYYWVDTTLIPLRNEHGKICEYMAIRADITEKKELAAELMHQDRLASVGLLASGLAHEIGTPLGVVRGRAELIQMRASQDESLMAATNVIIVQIDRISKLISSLLRFSRSSEGIQLDLVSLSDVVDESRTLVADKLLKHRIEFITDLPNGICVRGDMGRVEQVLINLFVNAIHAIEAEVERPGGRAEGHQIRVVAKKARDGAISLEIIDSGIGIESAHMNSLFKPFFTTKDVGKGTGLGLAIVLKILNEIGASIRVESERFRGTTFKISFERVP